MHITFIRSVRYQLLVHKLYETSVAYHKAEIAKHQYKIAKARQRLHKRLAQNDYRKCDDCYVTHLPEVHQVNVDGVVVDIQ